MSKVAISSGTLDPIKRPQEIPTCGLTGLTYNSVIKKPAPVFLQ